MNISQILKKTDLPPNILNNSREYIHAVHEGIPGSVVRQAVTELGSRDLFIRLLDTKSANLSRFYAKKKLTKIASEGVLDTLRVFSMAISVFEDKDKADEWLHERIPALAGERPVDLCDTFEGRMLVKQSLMAIEYGEFN